ncbi:MAG: PilN domain-containing protein [Candidatus Buchananbacteria bacterium]
MITLNLVPPKQQDQLKNNRLYQAIQESLTLLFLFAAIIGILLLVSRYFLEQQLNEMITQNAANIYSNQLVAKKINALNQELSVSLGLQKNYQPVTPLISAVSYILPANVAISNLRFFRQESRIEFSGSAKTRSDLMKFKNYLDKADWLSNAEIPLSALVPKENNTFSIKANINYQALTPANVCTELK